ncbi:MAG: alpha/beta hydrolase [Thermoplasmatota archaeon]
MRPRSLPPLARVLLVGVALLAGCTSGAPSALKGAACTPPIVQSPGSDVCFVTDDGWTLYGKWVDGGNATSPAFILVHGLNDDHGSFDRLAQDILATRSAPVLWFDLRGNGRSTLHNGTTTGWQTFTPADFVAMDNDLRAAASEVHARVGAARPIVLVGASIGANLALRFASDHVGSTEAVVLLSVGLDYHGVVSEPADRNYSGRLLFVASEGDSYAADSSNRLAAESIGALHDVRILGGSAHGTEMLKNADTRAFVESWISAHA